MKKFIALFLSMLLCTTLFVGIPSKKISATEPDDENQEQEDPETLEEGSEFTLNGVVYTVAVDDDEEGEVVYTKLTNKKLKSAIVPESISYSGINYYVTSIEEEAFKNNGNLTKVTIGKNVLQIGDSAFEGCKKLKKVTGGNDIESIGASAFKGCKSLVSVTLMYKVEEIGDNAFNKCTKLKTIKIKSTNLDSIGNNAIKGINKKATIKVPRAAFRDYKKMFTRKTGFTSTMKIKK